MLGLESKRDALLNALAELEKTGGKVIRDLEGLRKYVPYAEQALWLALKSKTEGKTPIPLPPLLVQGIGILLEFHHNGNFLCPTNTAICLGHRYNLDMLAVRYSRAHWLKDLIHPDPRWVHTIWVCCWKLVDGTPTIARKIYAAGPNRFDHVATLESEMATTAGAKDRPVKSYAPLATTNHHMGMEILALQHRQDYEILHVCGVCGHGIDANGNCTRCKTQVAPSGKVERRSKVIHTPFELASVDVEIGQKPFEKGLRYQHLGF